MTEPNIQNKKPEEERRYDPELLKKGLRCDLDQYEMLKRCSEKKDMTEWNQWRKDGQWDLQRGYKDEDIYLEGAEFRYCSLKGVLLSTDTTIGVHGKVYLNDANFIGVDLEHAELDFAHFKNANLNNANLNGASLFECRLQGAHLRNAHLEGANLRFAHLESADLLLAHLKGTQFVGAHLENALVHTAIVDGSTLIWKCDINRRCKKQDGTDFSGVGLGSCRIDPGTKQLLQYNIRRKNWEEWYGKDRWWQRILKRLFVWPFWLISDYGLRIWRIIVTFFGLAFVFALVYWLLPSSIMVNGTAGDIRGLWHALYFSVVTMTTLGFGDIAANPDSWVGQTLLMVQVIMGYVLLGALVTRFAVLFTAGGPAGTFADDKE